MVRKLIVILHSSHSPSSILLFDSEEEAIAFEDPDGGTIEWWAGADGVRHPIGTWAMIDPNSLMFVDNARPTKS